MADIAVALAIELEEKFKGSICYFGRAPHEHAKKPAQIIIIHHAISGALTIECLDEGSSEAAQKFASAVYMFISTLTIRVDDAHQRQPVHWVKFENVDEVETLSTLADFVGYAFTTKIIR